MSETNNLNRTWQTGQTQTGWLFTSVVENLNPNWPPWKKNPASGEDWTPACKFQLSNRSITQPPQQGGTRNTTVRGYTLGELIGSKEAPNVWNPGVLILYKNHPAGNPGDKYKTRKFDVVGERPATKYIQNIWTDLTSPQITVHIFWTFKTKWCEPFDCATGISGFPHVNSKCSRLPSILTSLRPKKILERLMTTVWT